MIGDEAAVEHAAFLFEHANGHFYAGVAQPRYAPPAYCGKGVGTSHHHALYVLAHEHVGTRRRLAVVGAWLKTHVNRGARQQALVLYRSNGVHFGMGPAAVHVVALAYYTAVAHNYRAHHRIGRRPEPAVGSQLQAAAHVFFICIAVHRVALKMYFCSDV